MIFLISERGFISLNLVGALGNFKLDVRYFCNQCCQSDNQVQSGLGLHSYQFISSHHEKGPL